MTRMRKVLLTLGSLLAVTTIGVSIVAANYEPVYAPGTMLGNIKLDGLTPVEAADKVKKWWGAAQMDLYTLKSDKMTRQLPPMTLGEWGLVIDIPASLAPIPTESFGEMAQRSSGIGAGQPHKFGFVWTFDDQKIKKVADFVQANRPPFAKARVFFENGAIKRQKESASIALDQEKLVPTLVALVDASQSTGSLPLTEAPKQLPDEELAKIKEVVASFTTHFPSYQSDRNTNIQIASGKIDGTIILPGQTFSFNDVVGRRTPKEGYREAPVLVNGRHESGIGGGCCQVSTTLYNAALLANLGIVERNNHSIPSVYVTPGRDAMVAYGSSDLKFKNTGTSPIAIGRKYVSGSITFYVLGTKVPNEKVEIVTSGVRYLGGGSVSYISDPSLTVGRTRVVERGSSRRTASAWRLIYQNGKLVKKESLGTSYYPGGATVIARGTRSKPKAKAIPSATPAPAAPAPPTDSIPPDTSQ